MTWYVKRKKQSSYLMHYGVKGQKWGERNYQNEDGSYTPEGLRRLHQQLKERKKRQEAERSQWKSDYQSLAEETSRSRKIDPEFEKELQYISDYQSLSDEIARQRKAGSEQESMSDTEKFVRDELFKGVDLSKPAVTSVFIAEGRGSQTFYGMLDDSFIDKLVDYIDKNGIDPKNVKLNYVRTDEKSIAQQREDDRLDSIYDQLNEQERKEFEERGRRIEESGNEKAWKQFIEDYDLLVREKKLGKKSAGGIRKD